MNWGEVLTVKCMQRLGHQQRTKGCLSKLASLRLLRAGAVQKLAEGSTQITVSTGTTWWAQSPAVVEARQTALEFQAGTREQGGWRVQRGGGGGGDGA